MPQTTEQIQQHYSIEKELANLLRTAPRQERIHLYTYVYDQLYKRVPHHPMLTAKREQAQIRKTAVLRKTKMLAPYLQTDSVYMEIGAGDCLMSMEMAAKVQKVIAVEVSSVIAERKDIPENMSIEIISQPDEIPATPMSIDLAYSDQLAEHLHPEDFLAQCKNVYKSLRSGGNYVIVTPNQTNGPHDVSRGFDAIATGMHLKEYTYTELHHLMQEVGFKNVKPIVGFNGMYIRIPAPIIFGLESLCKILPKNTGIWFANTLPIQMLLAIRLIATK